MLARSILESGEDTTILEERAVVAVDCAVNIIRKQVVHGVAVYPRRQPKDFVRYGTDFEADALLLHLLHNVGMPR